ncbi:hypothetical protein [Arthrobacter sp. ZGTC412]|uniref:hypothetical protein n=1 Tax=Arthrobacter sp. ZGTC412 TaxID=2058900 RepID=UPI000CE2C0DB|nr:hypothetical protein [Arthrobacter sp. ZGTC412]
MKNYWYLPIAAVVGVTSLTVWGQANAGPPPEVSPGVVVTADVTSGSSTPAAEDTASLLPTQTPPASITAIPKRPTQETQLVPAEPQTYAPQQSASPSHEAFDDKGGLRADNISDDPPGDDKGGLRADNVSDDPPGDDKGGLRDNDASDDAFGDDKGGDR